MCIKKRAYSGPLFTLEQKVLMRKYHSENQVVHLGLTADPDVIVEVTLAQAGWVTINFQLYIEQRGGI